MNSAKPGDPNVICHFCGCQSPHAYACGDCQHEFCLSCVPTQTPNPAQDLHCPVCGSRNIRAQNPADPD